MDCQPSAKPSRYRVPDGSRLGAGVQCQWTDWPDRHARRRRSRASQRRSRRGPPPARNTADRSDLVMTPPDLFVVSPKETVCRSYAVYRQLRPRARFSTRCETSTSRELKMTTKTLLTPTEVWSEKIYSNGWKKPGLGTADVIEKATGAKLGEIGVASAADVSAAAAPGRQGQEEWAKLPGPKRGDVLREFSRLLLVHAGEIADQLVRETGSIRAKAQWEIDMTVRAFQEAAALATQPQGLLTGTFEAGRQSIARRIPVGVIGIITPWTSPLIRGARAVAPALAMGNAVILKPDLQTPIIGGVAFARLLGEAGLANGPLHVLA